MGVPLEKGIKNDFFSTEYSTDIIETGDDSSAQIKFADGAIASLSPNSELMLKKTLGSKNELSVFSYVF